MSARSSAGSRSVDAVDPDDAVATLDAVLDATDDAVIGLDVSGRITSWNRSAERMLGYTAPDVVGMPSTDLFADHLRADATLVLETVLAGHHVRHLDSEMLRKDGMPVAVSLAYAPLLRGPAPHGCVAVVRDVTEQRLAQATLAEIESRLCQSEALAHVGSWLWDVGTDSVQWSEELHRIHGVDPLDFDGTLAGHLERVFPGDRDRVAQAMADAVRTGHTFQAEYRLTLRSGELRLVVASAESMRDSSGAVLGLRGIVQDVSERRA